MSVEVSIEAVLAHCTREGLEALIARKVRSGEAPTREELVQLAGEPETGSVQTGTKHLSKTDDFGPTFLRGNDFKPDADLTFSEVSVSADGFKRVGVLNERDRQRGASLPPYTSDARFPGRGVPLGPMSRSCKSGTQWLLCSPLMLVCGAKYSEDTSRCHCDLQCPQGCGEGREFLAAIQAFESCIKRAAATYSQEWFNTSSLSAKDVDSRFIPAMRGAEQSSPCNNTGPRRLRVYIRFEKEGSQCELYSNEQRTLFPKKDADCPKALLSILTKGTRIEGAILRCQGINIWKGRFWCSWALFQAVVDVSGPVENSE
mmetsp:Transcript_57658/g.158362  ORF Transcript_57658/g.158362 Transcript_57658/m.158362 type:complete len:316 (+) Transcript_57658:32-979(+)